MNELHALLIVSPSFTATFVNFIISDELQFSGQGQYQQID
jgi:hypothetical protein